MIEVVKLTNSQGYTRNNTLWDVGRTNTVEWGGRMCRAGCLHGYRSLELAVMANPVHSCSHARALICTTPEILDDDGLKIGMAQMTGVRWVDVPDCTTDRRMGWALNCCKLRIRTPFVDQLTHEQFKEILRAERALFWNSYEAALLVEDISLSYYRSCWDFAEDPERLSGWLASQIYLSGKADHSPFHHEEPIPQEDLYREINRIAIETLSQR